MADGFVVLAEFDVAPGRQDDFMRLVRANAEASVRDEPGCRRFDVLTPEASAERVVLYEIYQDRDAFDAHLKMPHFAAFAAATKDMVRGRVVRRFDLDENAS